MQTPFGPDYVMVVSVLDLFLATAAVWFAAFFAGFLIGRVKGRWESYKP